VNVEAADLKEGAKGSAVYDVQSRLAVLGYSVGEVDGVFGKATLAAVERFQRDTGLLPDGVVGEQTQRVLENAASRKDTVSRGVVNKANASRIILTAKQYIGVPYVFGGESPKGFDCSGFTQFVFAKHGVDLPRTADVQYGVGTAVSKNNLQPGDLVFFSTYLPGPSHVGIYIGDGQFINAQSSKGVAIAKMSSKYWASRYIGARRVLR
jgi:cell wall-associated NlpC family hydrolase